MIVMKFGGTSVADSDRIRAIAEIVRGSLAASPVVVVSALHRVTDLLEQAISCAHDGDLERLDPVLAELERRHRWVLSGALEQANRRHALSVELAGLFDGLRANLRSVRNLGERTAKIDDQILAFGELTAARLIAAAFEERGLPSEHVDARTIVATDGRHGAASPRTEEIARRCEQRLVPLLADGRVPVMGGFVGATESDEPTTLGRGGSDTTAALVGLAIHASEIQIWTDVDGWMTADPRLVPDARTLERVSFGEAAELARLGARVLHPHAVAPAVREAIPVRVLNSQAPGGSGTRIVGLEPAPDAEPLTSLASRRGLAVLRATPADRGPDRGLLTRLFSVLERFDLSPEVWVGSEVAVSVAVSGTMDATELERALAPEVAIERLPDRAILGVVGPGVSGPGALCGELVAALSRWQPDIIALGGSRTSLVTVLPEQGLEPALRELHRRFFERSPIS